MDNQHSLLKRQLKRFSLDPESLPQALQEFVSAVNDAYIQSDADRNMLERSLELSSNELMQANSELRAVFKAFPDMFFRMTQDGKFLEYKIGTSESSYPNIKQFIGKSISDIQNHDLKKRLKDTVDEVVRTKSLVTIQLELKIKEQAHFFEARFSPLLGNQIICIVRNITETKRAEEELKQSEQQYRTVLETSPDPIIVYDMEGKASYANPAFTRVFGWSIQEIDIKKASYIPEKYIEENKKKWKLLQNGSAFQGFETTWYDKKGNLLQILMNSSIRYDKSNTPIGAVITLLDITQQKQLEAELRITKEKAESANQAKSEFLANMSHELRTPMHAVLGFAKLAMAKIQHLKNEKIISYLEEIYNSGQRLMLLLNDLLDLSKLEVGQTEYDFEQERLSIIVIIVMNEFNVVSKERGTTIRFKEPTFEDIVLIDTHKIMQVIRNLLSNAIKFSNPKGNIEISLSQQNDYLQFSIKDQGIGIPPNELDSVFDKFVQSSKTKSGAGGTGLGLAICHEIIKAHSGKIWAENNANGGVTFHFLLPQN